MYISPRRGAPIRKFAFAVLAAALVCVGCAWSGPVGAQAWPARLVRLAVPSPAGSGIDVVARMISQRLGAQWGRPVIVENRPDVARLLNDPEVRQKKLLAMAHEPSGIGPPEFAALIKREFAERALMVGISGAKPE